MQRSACIDFRLHSFCLLSLTSLALMRARVPMSDPPGSSAAPRCIWEAESSESLPCIDSPCFRMRCFDLREAVGPIEAGRRSPSQDGIAVPLELPSGKSRAAGTFQAKATPMHVMTPRLRRRGHHARHCATPTPAFFCQGPAMRRLMMGGALTSRSC